MISMIEHQTPHSNHPRNPEINLRNHMNQRNLRFRRCWKGLGIGGLLLLLILASGLFAQGLLTEVQSFPSPRGFDALMPLRGLLGSPTGLVGTRSSNAGIMFFIGGDTLAFLNDSILTRTIMATDGYSILENERPYLVRLRMNSIMIHDIGDTISSIPQVSLTVTDYGLKGLTGSGTDINGDGRDDFVAVWFNTTPPESSGIVYFSGGLSDSLCKIQTMNHLGGNYASYFDSRGDLNGDGATDIVCSNPAGTNVDIWFGRRDMDFPAEPDLILHNSGSDAGFGAGIQTATDFNGDGYKDVAVASGHPAGYPYGNYEFIYFGGNPMDNIADLIISLPVYPPEYTSGSFYSGDFNGDGYGDYIFGPTCGYRIYYGGPSPPYAIADTFTPYPFSWAGACVIGDYNGDGADDVVLTGGTIRYLRHPHPHSAVDSRAENADDPRQPLMRAEPNPVTNGALRCSFYPPGRGHLRADIFDVTGRRVWGLLDLEVVPGVLDVTWQGETDEGCLQTSGAYVLRTRFEDRQTGEAEEVSRTVVWVR